MDNLGDLLYLFFILGAVLLSVLKKKYQQPNSQPASQGREEEEGDDEWPEELKRLFGEPEKTSVVEVPMVQQTKPVSVSNSVQIQTGLHTTIASKSRPNTTIVEEDEEHVLIGNADWSDAVIYSEVLKRPSWD